MKYVFDLKETTSTSARPTWAGSPGHSYVVYGPLAAGATVLMYEGAPNFPEPDRFWPLIDRHRATILYTAPTAIRAFMRWGDDYVKRHRLDSLRLLGSVGEPINPEAWMWYYTVVGKKRCPIVDTWWQTETGAIMVTPLPGVTPLKPGSCAVPFFGVVPKVLDEQGKDVPSGSGGTAFPRQAVAGDAQDALGRRRPLSSASTGASCRDTISRVTARASTRTAISGSSAELTTC